MTQITDRTAILREYERETRAFYRVLGMSQETADRAIRVAEKAIPHPKTYKQARARLPVSKPASSGWKARA
jgi:hypothetical protein